jgi:adenylosuccinate lyase
MENVALWHERDISHSSAERVILPDACLVIDYILDIFTNVIDGLLVYPERMKKNLDITKGLLFSQRVLLALIDKGLGRQEAYRLVQRNAMKTWKGNKRFLNLLKADKEVAAVLPAGELESLFDYQYYLRHVDDVFARLGLTEAQWKDKTGRKELGELAPRSV